VHADILLMPVNMYIISCGNLFGPSIDETSIDKSAKAKCSFLMMSDIESKGKLDSSASNRYRVTFAVHVPLGCLELSRQWQPSPRAFPSPQGQMQPSSEQASKLLQSSAQPETRPMLLCDS
jgi:hypothetical protein